MRVEPFTVGSYVHVLKRGARGMPITKDDSDKQRFLKVLYYLNDVFREESWDKEVASLPSFSRPSHWPEREPLLKILSYCLMPNHFHLLLKEITDGGVSLFMQKIGGSITTHFNQKYREKGSIFQGAYKSRTVSQDNYFRHLAVYIMVKNPFELYPGGLEKAVLNFEDAWKWAMEYPFSSLADYGSNKQSPITEKDLLGEIFSDFRDFKNFARETICGPVDFRKQLGEVFLE